MHTEPLYRLVVDLREERATFLNRLEPLQDYCEVDGSYLFDCVVENCYGVGKTLDQLTAGLSPEMGGKLMHLLEQAWQMVNTAIRHAERQADAQVKHLYPANWCRMRQTQDSLDMYYTQLAPDDPLRITQVEGIDPEDQVYLDNVIAGEVATEEAVEKAESDLGLAAKEIAKQVQATHPEAFERLKQMDKEQLEQAMEDHLEGVKANWSTAQHSLANPVYVETTIDIPEPGSPEAQALLDRVLQQPGTAELFQQLLKVEAAVPQPTSSFSRLLEQERGFTEQWVAERGIEALPLYHALRPNPELEAKLNEITHPNREMIDRAVREHNTRHFPTQSS